MKRRLIMALTLMTAGRAMTVLFIGRAGDGGVGDPPQAWLMPLIGDAIIGGAAVVIALMIWKRPSPATWVTTAIWTSIGAFDAMAAFIVETSAPWPDFFMIEIFGRSMFFAATALHLVILWLLTRRDVMADFSIDRSGPRGNASLGQPTLGPSA